MPYVPVYEEKRLHPATIIVQVVRFLRSIAFLLAIAIGMRIYGRSADMIEIVATFLGGLSIAGAVIKFITFRYSVRDGSLHITQGVIQREHRTIPLSRIQNINLKQDLIHRMLGVADVRIETASGGEAEGELSVVTLAEAEAIRAALSAPHDPLVIAEAPPVETVYHASLKDLIVAGATQNRLGTIVAGVIGILFYVNTFSPRDQAFFKWIENAARHYSVPGWTTISLALIGLVAVGWLASIVLTVIHRFGFALTRSQGQLQRSFGLLTRHQSIFPVERVQMLRIVSPVIQRRVGLCRIDAETAGSFKEDEQRDRGTNELCPILKRDRADGMCRLVLPSFALDDTRLESIHPLGKRRAWVRAMVGQLILIGAASWFYSPWVWTAATVAPVVAWAYAVLYFRSQGFALTGEHLVVRDGIWTRTLEVVPLTKIQASFVQQSPLQRRLGLASFEVMTAGRAFGRSATIPDIALDVAIRLQDDASERGEAALVMRVDDNVPQSDAG